jgi:hypothetical protein
MGDEFSDAVKKALAGRVGYLCSNPSCRALTSGPQDDPAKTVNVGVAAHITAASHGGPRYDPDLLPEERSGPGNGIWLCQNHGKLVDNDPARFPVEVLKKWKTDAEAEARNRVGKTAAFTSSPPIHLNMGARVRISPIVPREFKESDFILEEITEECFVFKKADSTRQVDIPKTFVEKIHSFGNSKPARIELSGRLQWLSRKRIFDLLPEKPPAGATGAYGIGKEVDPAYPARFSINGTFGREARLPELFAQGWLVFYDSDGKYLRWGDQILVIRWL